MKLLRRILPFAVILGAVLLVLYSPDIAPEKYADLASFFKVERARQGFSGYSIAAVSDGAVLYVDGFGADGGGRPIDADTELFATAAEKSFVALAALSLAKERALDLDAPARSYLPRPALVDASGGDASIRQLISRGYGALGSKLGCLDADYRVIALAMESATGRPIAEVVDERVFKVLGMKATTMEALESPPKGDGTFFSSAIPRDARYPDGGAPSGRTATSASDMGAYLAYVLDPGRARRAPVAARAARAIFEPAVEGAPYGYGWFLGGAGGARAAYHDGSVAGFSSRVLVMPEAKAGIAVLAAQGSYLQSLIALPALTDGAMRIMRDGSTTRPFPLHRLYILLFVVAAVHLIALGAQTGGAIGWARDVRGRAEARGTRLPVRFAAARSWAGISVRSAIAVLAPAALSLALDRSVGWGTIFDFEPGAAAWCLSACFFGVLRNVARLAWLGRPTFIPRAARH
jgi:CubicO group peptidase (beta-lactamase class C family)